MNRRRWLKSGLLAAAGLALTARRVSAATPARVIVAGGGFGGSACALELRRQNPALEILLVDPEDRYLTCPMSNQVLVGLRTPGSLAVSRAGLRAAGVLVVRDRVTQVDARQRNVRLSGGASLPYDRLVIAPGIRFLWDRIEGLSEQASLQMPHAWVAGEQTLRLQQQLQGMPDGGVVAISIPSGFVRCPPGPYERASLFAHYLKAHKPRSKLLLLDANNSFPRQPQFQDAWQRLYPGLIEWIPMTRDGAVVRVDPGSRTLFTAGSAHRVAVASVIPPQAPGELALLADLASDHGWCPVDPVTFESRNAPAVHVIGDACIAGAMPKSGSAAVNQALHCAAAIVALLDERAPAASAFDSVCYAYLAPSLALSLPGHFTIDEGSIVAPVPKEAPPARLDTAVAAAESGAAARWYRSIRAQAFGA